MTLPMTSGRVPLKPLNLEGTVHVEGNMTHFVTEDLEYKIKLSSPVTKKGDTPPLPGNSKTGKGCQLTFSSSLKTPTSCLLNN